MWEKKLIVAKMEKNRKKPLVLKNTTRYLSEICLANFEFLILLMTISKKKVMQKEKERNIKQMIVTFFVLKITCKIS